MARSRATRENGSRSLFRRAYLEGVPRQLAPVDGAVRSPGPMAAPAESIALGGTVLTADGPVRGWVTVEAGRVAAITTRKPTTSVTVATDGIILPGLIDLHGHPEFNVFAAWEPPKAYLNRYAWRASEPYQELVRDPQDRLLAALPSGTQLRYAEIRAVVGGTTAIQGASGRTQRKAESLVRNVDGPIFGEHRARSVIDLPSKSSRGAEDLRTILAGVAEGEVAALYIHLAEGRRDNERSVKEFDRLVELDGLTEATVIIHGTAMTREQLGAAAEAGAKLVWSPQSNLRLYGETTRIADALDVGLPVGLGADWLPSGSTSLLAEMKVARQELVNQGHPVEARELVEMVTSGAARIAALDDHLGTLERGRPADLVVLARNHPDPYESVCESIPNDVELVLIGGDIVYGRDDWVRTLAPTVVDDRLEPVLAWGRRMLLDTSFEQHPDEDPTPRLQELRDHLVQVYPQVGPIWA